MVSLNARPAPFLDPVSVSFNTTTPVTGRRDTASFREDTTTKIRKPYTIKKSRENWTEQEHDKFLEALHLYVSESILFPIWIPREIRVLALEAFVISLLC